VEIKAIDPPNSIKEAMEKQMRAERDKRATILHAEGERQSRILTAEGTRQQEILLAQGEQQGRILRADGEAKAIERVFQAVHRYDADPKLLAYKYLETLPKLADGQNNTFWVIPGEFTEALRTVTTAFGDKSETKQPAANDAGDAEAEAEAEETPQIGHGETLQIGPNAPQGALEALDAAHAADEVAKKAEAVVSEAKAEVKAVEAAAVGHGAHRG